MNGTRRMKGQPLTPREAQFLEAYVEHGSRKEAAAALDVPAQTVKNALVVVYAKLGVESAVQAGAAWERLRRRLRRRS